MSEAMDDAELLAARCGLDDPEVIAELDAALKKAATKTPEVMAYNERRFVVLDGADMAGNAKAPSYLIDGLLEEGTHGIMGGASGTYKTFISLRMAYSVCTGTPFMGRQVYRKGPVLYVCGEGQGGISRRLSALQLKLGRFPSKSFFVYGSTVKMCESESMQILHECLLELKPALVIFDTFATLAGGVEENSPSDVGQALGNVRRACPVGTSSLIVHHFGKDATRGFRGASSFTNDVDFAFVVSRPEGDQTARKACMVSHKMKDGDPFAPIHFKASPVPLGLVDQKGAEVYSLVVEDDSASAGVDVAAIMESGAAWQKALEALRICWSGQRDALELAGHSGKNPSVAWDDWRTAMVDLGLTNPRRARDELKEKDLIECLAGNEYRPK